MAFLKLILLAIVLYTCRELYNLYINYSNARKTGLKIVFSPLDPHSLLWQIGGPAMIPLLKKLPRSMTRWCRLVDMGWSWQSDDDGYRELGLNIILVCTRRNVLFSSDPESILWILQKRKDFIKPEVYESLNIYGRNVDTVNGEEWARHRKLTAPCFNERVSGFVWDESIRQANTMRDHWLSLPAGRLSNLVEDTRIVALHVLSAAGFGVSLDFHKGAREPAQGHSMSHRDALMTVLDNIIPAVIISEMPWAKPLLLGTMKRLSVALSEFRQYMDEMVVQERRNMAKEGGGSKANLISTLIRTSDDAKAEGVNSAVRLTDDEIKGNIFIFNLAGHDTTANTLAYAFAMLALYPEIQDWIMEEITTVLGSESHPEYEKAYPRLKRIQALMYETLRFYGPVPTIPRGVSAPSLPLRISSSSQDNNDPSTLIIPPNTSIQMSLHACHMNPTLYPSPKLFNPSRWIESPSSSSSLDEEVLLPHPLGFQPWSLGPRICPGMKFAQVEFAAVMATVLRKVRVAPASKSEGAGARQAWEEVYGAARDSKLNGPTLSMNRPADLYLRVEER
ncbi:cytochrome P450 [Polyplosphaeria fusca]|uniref:Cytochrome P450 n=1 Tax=Polyplosphaeria fusca TaxID=682080 RepID=A0A9P4QPU3_9PLEO|nr:cytochrome P450 [Polyplosphaeria fusca]